MPAAITLWVGSPVMSAPSNVILSARGGVKPRMERISVDFPEPFEPSRQVMCPGSTASETPSSTSALS
jgi:hypothetical protein